MSFFIVCDLFQNVLKQKYNIWSWNVLFSNFQEQKVGDGLIFLLNMSWVRDCFGSKAN